MQVKKLQELFGQYRSFLESPRAMNRLPYWETQQVFQSQWNLQADDLPNMLDQSFQNQTTRRIWKRDHWEPKRMLLELAALDPDFLRQALADLFNEEKDIEGRTTRFLFYTDELLELYRKANPRKIDTGHYLEDYEFIFLLLAFRYPDQYAPYPTKAFRRLLEQTLAPNISPAHDVARFVKVCKTLYLLMEKEEGLLEMANARLDERHYAEKSFLVVYDFLMAVTR